MLILRTPREFFSLNVGVMQILVFLGFIMVGIYMYLEKRKEDRRYLSKEIKSTVIIYTILMTLGMFGTAWMNNVQWNVLTSNIEQEKEEFMESTEGIMLGSLSDREVLSYMEDLYQTEADIIRMKKRKKEITKPIGKVFVEGSKQDLADFYDLYTEEERSGILKANRDSLNVFTDVDLALKDTSIKNNELRLTRVSYENIMREQVRLREELVRVREDKVEEETFMGVSKGSDVLVRSLWLMMGTLILSYILTIIVKEVILGGTIKGKKRDEDLDETIFENLVLEGGGVFAPKEEKGIKDKGMVEDSKGKDFDLVEFESEEDMEEYKIKKEDKLNKDKEERDDEGETVDKG